MPFAPNSGEVAGLGSCFPWRLSDGFVVLSGAAVCLSPSSAMAQAGSRETGLRLAPKLPPGPLCTPLAAPPLRQGMQDWWRAADPCN